LLPKLRYSVAVISFIEEEIGIQRRGDTPQLKLEDLNKEYVSFSPRINLGALDRERRA
jgi:hypothetical protein